MAMSITRDSARIKTVQNSYNTSIKEISNVKWQGTSKEDFVNKSEKLNSYFNTIISNFSALQSAESANNQYMNALNRIAYYERLIDRHMDDEDYDLSSLYDSLEYWQNQKTKYYNLVKSILASITSIN